MPKPSPSPDPQRAAMGFFVHVFSTVLMAIYLIWMFSPDEFLHKFDIYYYPNRNWGILVPLLFLVSVICIPVGYAIISISKIPAEQSAEHLNSFI